MCVQNERGEVISNYKWYFTCDDTKLQKQQPQNDDSEKEKRRQRSNKTNRNDSLPFVCGFYSLEERRITIEKKTWRH